MKQLNVENIDNRQCTGGLDEVSACLNKMEKQELAFSPWQDQYPYKPSVQFSVAHNNKSIFLKFFVEEKFIRAAAGNINGAVWQDACVEFFISFDETGYYNLEFNCIGTILAGFGKDKTNRLQIPEPIIRNIKYQVLITNNKENNIYWELTLDIPVTIFIHHQLNSLQHKNSLANFYKCGDGLPQPHFISWSNIKAPSPDFHLPAFFGNVLFK